MNWSEYQEAIANSFRSVGLQASTNQLIQGARGQHNIDVVVRGKIFGQDLFWICECKLWQTSIPKEKILAFQQIVQDVGADKGFILSESGFQSGAIRAVANTNMVLINQQDITSEYQNISTEGLIVSFLKKVLELREKAKYLWLDTKSQFNPFPGIDPTEAIQIDGHLMYETLAISKNLIFKFPIFLRYNNEVKRSDNQAQLLENSDAFITYFTNRIDTEYALSKTVVDQIIVARESYIKAIRDLAATAFDICESPIKSDSRELLCIKAVTEMKIIYSRAEDLSKVSRNDLRRELSIVMNLLIDGLYLDLTKETISKSKLRKTQNELNFALDNLLKMTP